MVKKSKGKPRGPFILMIVGALLILGAVGWTLIVLNPLQSPASQITGTSPGNYPQVVRVSPEDAKKAYDEGGAVFIDVRSQQEYEQQHVPGALSIPLLDLGTRIGELNPNAWYITY